MGYQNKSTDDKQAPKEKDITLPVPPLICGWKQKK